MPFVAISPYDTYKNIPLCTFNSELYCICSTASNNYGVLFQYDLTNNVWVPKTGGLPIAAYGYALQLIVFNNKLYTIASANVGNLNQGLLYEWDGVSAWVQKAPSLFGAGSIIHAHVNKAFVYNNQLWVSGLSDQTGQLVVYWDGVSAWVTAWSTSHITNNPMIGAFGGNLYASNLEWTFSGTKFGYTNLYQWNGTSAASATAPDKWTLVANQINTTSLVYEFYALNNGLYANVYDSSTSTWLFYSVDTAWHSISSSFDPTVYFQGAWYGGKFDQYSNQVYSFLEGGTPQAFATLPTDYTPLSIELATLNNQLYASSNSGDGLLFEFVPPSPKLVGSNLNGGAYRVSRRLL